jgi:hypothetical protein
VEERNEEGERGSQPPIEGGGRGEAIDGVEALKRRSQHHRI